MVFCNDVGDVMVFLQVKSWQPLAPLVSASANAVLVRRLSFAFVEKEDFLFLVTPVTQKTRNNIEKNLFRASL